MSYAQTKTIYKATRKQTLIALKYWNNYPLKSRSKASGMLKKRKQIESEQTRTLEFFV